MENEHKKYNKSELQIQKYDRRILLIMISMFILLCILILIDEALDLPHFLLKVTPTPFNWKEAIIEIVFIVCIGLFTVLNLISNINKYQRMEKVLKES